MPHIAVKLVSLASPFAENITQIGVINRAVAVRQQILLAHICNIAAVIIFSEQMVKWLIF